MAFELPASQQQYVSVCGTSSDTLPVDYGIVQASTLGPFYSFFLGKKCKKGCLKLVNKTKYIYLTKQHITTKEC